MIDSKSVFERVQTVLRRELEQGGLPVGDITIEIVSRYDRLGEELMIRVQIQRENCA